MKKFRQGTATQPKASASPSDHAPVVVDLAD